jgi:hypothetical protein
VPCPVISPSCSTGGTHATKVESYLRIVRDEGANTWTVWRGDGTELTYRPLTDFPVANPSGLPPEYDFVRDRFRWLLASVSDPHNNVVTYNYWCDFYPACYIDTIAYNGNTIRFYRETRTIDTAFVDDVFRFITYFLYDFRERLRYRLKSIDVMAGVQRSRTYALTYDPISKRSRLTSVKQFGRDAVLDSGGSVTVGTMLPPTTFSYSAGPATFQLETVTPTPPTSTVWLKGDFDGNGKADFVRAVNACTLTMLISNGSLVQSEWTTSGCTTAPTGVRYVGDYNADGKSDLAVLGTASASVYLSNGSGFALQTWPYQGTAEPSSSVGWIPAELNGDGKTDFIRNQIVTTGTWPNVTCKIYYRISTGAAFERYSWTHSGCLLAQSPTNLDVGDFNGDGLTDVAKRVYPTGGQADAKIYHSTGTGFEEMYVSLGGTQVSGEKWLIADVTGDGRSDFVKIFAQGAVKKLYVYPNNQADGSYDWGSWTTSSTDWAIADVNGDGLADLVNTTGSRADVLLSNGAKFFGSTWLNTGSFAGSPIPADVNGDGKVDIVKLNSASGGVRPQFVLKSGLSTDAASDLLTEVENGIGGSTTVQYTPSSAWTNTNLPFILQIVSSVAADDGRGTLSTTGYTYSAGDWNYLDRRFLGFGTVIATLPCNAGETQCPKVETTFRQTLACRGKAHRPGRDRVQPPKRALQFTDLRNVAGSRGKGRERQMGARFLGCNAALFLGRRLRELHGSNGGRRRRAGQGCLWA